MVKREKNSLGTKKTKFLLFFILGILLATALPPGVFSLITPTSVNIDKTTRNVFESQDLFLREATKKLGLEPLTMFHSPDIVNNLVVYNNTLYASTASGIAIYSFDVDSISMAFLGDATDGFGGYRILYHKGYALLLDKEWIDVFDVSNVSKPVLVKRYYNDLHMKNWALEGDILYVFSDYYGLIVLNVSNPANIYALLRYNPGSSWSDMDYYQNKIYLLSYYDGIFIIDVSDPTHPSLLSTYQISYGERIYVENNLAFVEANSSTYVYNVQNPASVQALTKIDIIFRQAKLIGSYLYTVCNKGFSILDMSDPSDPVLLGSFWEDSYDFVGTFQVFTDAKIALLVNVMNGIKVLNISDPSSISRIKTFVTYVDYDICQIEAVGNYLFVLDFSYGLFIYDVTDPLKPVLRYYFVAEDDRAYYHFHYASPYLFVGTNKGVMIYNVLNMDSVSFIGQINVSSYNQIYYDTDQNHLYIAYGTSIRVYGFSTNPFSYNLLEEIEWTDIAGMDAFSKRGELLFTLISNGIGVFRVTEDLTYTYLGGITGIENPYTIFAPEWAPNHVFIISEYDGVSSYEVKILSNGTYTFEKKHSLSIQGYPQSWFINGTLAFIHLSYGSELNVIDLKDPENFTIYYKTENIYQVEYSAYSNGYFYVASRNNGIKAYKTYNSSLASAPQNLLISGDKSFVTLTWEQPSDTGGAPVMYYNVYRALVTSSTSLTESYYLVGRTNADQLVFKDYIQENYLKYEYKYVVTAVTPVGEGETSTPATYKYQETTSTSSTTTSSSTTTTSTNETSSTPTTTQSQTTTSESGFLGLSWNYFLPELLLLPVFLKMISKKNNRKA